MPEEIRSDRLRKLKQYRMAAGTAYPERVKVALPLGEFLRRFTALECEERPISVLGRLGSIRNQGGVLFTDIRDEHDRLQLVFMKRTTKQFALLQDTLDSGDFLEATGLPGKTKRGEKSLFVRRARIIAKSIRPIPADWYGIEDIETRLRKRYLDFLAHPETRELFVKKCAFWDTVRASLKEAGFLEVETPTLELTPGGAEALPFITHHNALDTDFYLRISLELPLKKLLVGGFLKVFEIGRIFRNEGIDREHLQDYTQMECYASYQNYEDMMRFTRQMYRKIVKTLFGTLKITVGKETVDWGKPWPRADYYTVFQKETGLDLATVTVADLMRKAKTLELNLPSCLEKGRLIDLVYKKAVRPKLRAPCFLVDPPIEVEPLAKRLVRDPQRVARFQIMALGTELGKGFSELNDPLDQRKRFEEQARLRETGDEEAQRLDEDYLEAMEYGMPPAAGFGMSERLFAVLMAKPIRETVIFPLMRQKERQ